MLGRDLRDLHAVDVANLRRGGDEFRLKLDDVDMLRRAFEQDIAGLADETIGRMPDQHRDGDGKQRVDRKPACRSNHKRRDDRRNRSKKVTDNMQHRAADVQISLVAAMQDCKCNGVGGKPDDCDAKHQTGIHLNRTHKSFYGFNDDPAKQHGEQHAIDEGRENLRAAIPEMQSRVRGAGRKKIGARRESKRNRIGKHVRSVG